MDQCYKHIAEAKWVENRFAGRRLLSGSRGSTRNFSRPSRTRGTGRSLPDAGAGQQHPQSWRRIRHLERFPRIARRYAGLPVDENGKMQVAWEQDWMEKAIQEAHSPKPRHRSWQRPRPVGRTPDRVRLRPRLRRQPQRILAAQPAMSRSKQVAVPARRRPASHADTAVRTAPLAFSAAYLGGAPLSPSTSFFVLSVERNRRRNRLAWPRCGPALRCGRAPASVAWGGEVEPAELREFVRQAWRINDLCRKSAIRPTQAHDKGDK